MTKNLEGAQVGDEVVLFRLGMKGNIWGIDTDALSYPIKVKWVDGHKESYTIDGRLTFADVIPSIGFALPKIEYAPRPKKKVRKELTVYVNIYSNGVERSVVNVSEKEARENATPPAIAVAVPLTGTYEVEE